MLSSMMPPASSGCRASALPRDATSLIHQYGRLCRGGIGTLNVLGPPGLGFGDVEWEGHGHGRYGDEDGQILLSC
jgi:hypothetical protein